MVLIVLLIVVAVVCLIAAGRVTDGDGATALKVLGILAAIGAGLLLLFLILNEADVNSDIGAVVAGPLAFDDFERPDQTGLGTSPTGQAWSITGAGAATAAIVSGRYVNDGNSYATVDLSEPPVKIGGKFSFVAGGGADTTAGMALILAFQGGAGLLNDMVHLFFDYDSCRLSLWTSAATGNAVAVDSEMAAPSFPADTVLALTPGVEYEVQMTIVDDQVHVEFLQAGTVIRVIEASDPRVSTLVGSTPIWQIRSPVGNAGSLYQYRWHEVNAVRRQPATIEEELQATRSHRRP